MNANGSAEPAASLEFDTHGRLVFMDVNNQRHVGVEIVRAFPLSAPSYGIAIRDADGNELFWIDDLNTIPTALRVQVEGALAVREFLPVIRRIVRVSWVVDPSEWEVETDRGRTNFLVGRGSDVRKLGQGSILVVDTNGIRYLIPEPSSLDAASVRYLEQFE
jgi:hypothetical protein